LPILVADLEEAMKVGIFSKYDIKIAQKFWPGELTIVVPLKKPELKSFDFENDIELDTLVTGGKPTVALRVPKNEIILGICRELKKISSFGGVVGTSANYSGEPNCITGKQVSEQFSMTLNFIIDSGKCKGKIPSTIIKINKNMMEKGESIESCVTVFREGNIKKEDIINVLRR
jgi:tRNA A37 threonylcarbamoyladenosine synthetase subunit TsaC/SUA5/YrdC